jgi:hypothetical protein
MRRLADGLPALDAARAGDSGLKTITNAISHLFVSLLIIAASARKRPHTEFA